MSRAVCGPVTEESAKSSCVPWSSHSTSSSWPTILCSRRHWCRGCQPLLKTIPGLQRASMGPKGVFDADSPEDLPSIRTPYEPCEPVRSHQARCVRWRGSARGFHEPLHTRRWSVRQDGGGRGVSIVTAAAPPAKKSRIGTVSPAHRTICPASGVSYQLSETLPRRQPPKGVHGQAR